jgi:glycosyltransferase involved in cell wall biosynthesis
LKVWQFDPAQMTPYYNLSLCEALANAGCAVRYITSKFLYDPKLFASGHFAVDHHYFRLLDSPSWLERPRLRRLLRGISYPLEHRLLISKLRADPPDVFHMQWSRLPRVDRWLMDHVRALGIPIVFTVHEVIPLFADDDARASLAEAYRRADALIFHAEANRAEFVETYPDLPSDRLTAVIPHLALNNVVYPLDATRQRAREQLRLPPDAPAFLFFGSLRPYKGVDILVEAFARALKERPDLRLLLVGNPNDPSEIPDLSALGDLENVYSRLEYVPLDEMWLYHLAADVVVFPYRRVYQSGALLTAMGFGRAVIVSNVGGMAETVEGNGWIVPPEDPRRLARAILEAAADPARVQRMGERSLELVRQRHDPLLIAEQTISVYRALRVRK